MPVFSRRSEPPSGQDNYQGYRQYVRGDFVECCAYCLLHELLAGGEDNFELDHFQPQSKYRDFSWPQDFYNLYYACHVCNHYKSNSWPKPALLREGYQFVDPCRDNFSDHFQADGSGHWAPVTRAAEYTEARLRLNRRHLVEIRSLLTEIGSLRGIALDWNLPLKKQLEALLPWLQSPITCPKTE